jgi:hypothetical protein
MFPTPSTSTSAESANDLITPGKILNEEGSVPETLATIKSRGKIGMELSRSPGLVTYQTSI